ncbi:MAG: PKD domain-containing protein, partial [Phaeodactylibacter sp.]|nr:PKD domain-containing protein [Phaeodactylibacter sp.]
MGASFYQKSYALIWRCLLTLCIGLCWPTLSQASHIVGGDIVYKCLGGNQYEIILNVYRDCQNAAPGAIFDNPAKIGVFTQFSNNPMQVLTIPYDPMINDTISNNLTDPCLIITDSVCVHTTTYKTTINLSPITGGYTFVYQRCCRNIIIQNIVDPSNSGTTFSVRLTEQAMLECNNSPDFGSIAPIYICNQKPLIYDHSAVDLDGDSLSYRLCTPFLGGSAQVPQPMTPAGPPFTMVQWVTPFYGVNNMLGGTIQPLAIDSITGTLTAFPENIGTYVVGICVDEYRNGQHLSTVRRDFQYTIQECGEVISSFFSPDAQCEDLVIEFENESAFATDYEWYFDWPNTDLFSDEISPTVVFPDTGLYTVALIAEPGSACADTFFHQVFLQDNSLLPDFAFEIFDCEDNSVVQVQDLTLDTISTPTQWLWEISYNGNFQSSNEQNPTFLVPNPANVTLILTVRNESGCVRFAEQTFQTGNNFPAIFLQDLFEICEGDSVSLNPNYQDIGGYPYFWTPANLLEDPEDPNPTVAPSMTTLYTAQIFGPDSMCYIIHQATVIVNQQPELGFDTEVDCNGLTVRFDNISVDAPSYAWDFGDPGSGAVSTNENPIYTYPNFGDYTVTLSTGNGAACPDTITQVVSLEEQILEADFEFDITDCDNDGVTVQFFNTSINTLNNTEVVNWQIQGHGTFTVENPIIFADATGPIDVLLYIETEQGCIDTLLKTVNIQLIELDLPDDIVRCPDETIELNPGGNPNYTYTWSPAAGLSATDVPNPMASPSETTTYTVTVTQAGFEACSLSQEITVTVPPAIELNTGPDILTCDESAELTGNTATPATFQWTASDGSV